MKGRKKSAFWLKFLAAVLLTAAIVVIGFQTVLQVGAATGQQEIKILEDSLYRAAVSCYAIEGQYPPTLDYLTKNYGVVIDATRYAVFYEIFADNLMPEITVVALD